MFIELLIVLGVIGMITAIVIVAINPSKHICEAENGKRHIKAREFSNAINEYQIDSLRPAVASVPVGQANAQPICTQGVTNDATCINLDMLAPDYLLTLPQDDDEQNPNYTGYNMYRMTGGLDLVVSNHIKDCTEASS
jgi:type II secretory pathway pseudopilin PulG